MSADSMQVLVLPRRAPAHSLQIEWHDPPREYHISLITADERRLVSALGDRIRAKYDFEESRFAILIGRASFEVSADEFDRVCNTFAIEAQP